MVILTGGNFAHFDANGQPAGDVSFARKQGPGTAYGVPALAGRTDPIAKSVATFHNLKIASIPLKPGLHTLALVRLCAKDAFQLS